MSAVKKVCLNSSKNYYTGSELSPLHYGLSAEGYDINSIMEGYDKELWIVDVKNNKKVWVKNDHLSRITHEEPVIKNILSLYCDAEEIEKINQLKQKCGKDGAYNLKDIKKLYNICDDDCDNEADESDKEPDCSGHDCEGNDCKEDTSIVKNEEKEDIASAASDNANVKTNPTNLASGTKGSESDENYEGDVDDILKGAKGGKSRKGSKVGSKGGAKGGTKGETSEANEADAKGTVVAGKKEASDDKKPTDYNIFVKFRLNELKEISTNKKDNFENVKIEWRELKKNKTELKIVMDKAYSWLNQSK